MYKIKNAKVFLENPKLQERVFLINVQRNKWILRKDIKWFVGTRIDNTIITESGIIAAAHLAGPGNVKKYLRSGGKHNQKDVIKAMEMWWDEIENGSRRDQLSFNYAAWKTKTGFNWIKQDIRDDGYVLEVKHTHQKKK